MYSVSQDLQAPVARRKLEDKPATVEDKIFFGISTAAAYSSVVLLILIMVFLGARALPTFEEQGIIEFVFGTGWQAAAEPQQFSIGPMLWGSVLVSLIGVTLAVPMAISLAYFIAFLAPKRLARAATILVDLLAAIPSVIIGLWGLAVFSPVGAHWGQMLNDALGFIPIFENTAENFLRTPFIAGFVVAVMIVPIIASITREIFSQIDDDLIKAAVALGANRESTFRKVILPVSFGGIVGGVLLGLARALGETVAIFFVLNLIFDDFNWFRIISPEGGAIASLILAKFGEASETEISALLAAGVVLFFLTLIINTLASFIVAKAQPWRNR
jgi:phosphate transport system permease protein